MSYRRSLEGPKGGGCLSAVHDEICPPKATSFHYCSSCFATLPPIMSQARQPTANHAGRTTTQTSRESSTVRLPGTLRLRGDETPNTNEPAPARRIRWSEDVVNNEGMGKKSSKGLEASPPLSLPSQSSAKGPDCLKCAASTTNPDRLAKAAQSPSPLILARRIPIATVKVTAVNPGQTTRTIPTQEDDDRLARKYQEDRRTNQMIAARAMVIPSKKGGSQVRMHMKRCQRHRRNPREVHRDSANCKLTRNEPDVEFAAPGDHLLVPAIHLESRTIY